MKSGANLLGNYQGALGLHQQKKQALLIVVALLQKPLRFVYTIEKQKFMARVQDYEVLEQVVNTVEDP